MLGVYAGRPYASIYELEAINNIASSLSNLQLLFHPLLEHPGIALPDLRPSIHAHRSQLLACVLQMHC